MGLTVCVSPIFSGLGPCGCLWWMATWKHLTYSRLWCAYAEDEVVIWNKKVPRHRPVICCSSTQPPPFFSTPVSASQVDSSARRLSLSYIIHQVAITAADRTVYPSRPCVLPASVEVSVTLLPDWTSFRSTCGPSATIYAGTAGLGILQRGESLEEMREYQVSSD